MVTKEGKKKNKKEKDITVENLFMLLKKKQIYVYSLVMNSKNSNTSYNNQLLYTVAKENKTNIA